MEDNSAVSDLKDVEPDSAADDNSGQIMEDTCELYHVDRFIDRREQTVTIDCKRRYQLFKRQVCPVLYTVNIDNISAGGESADMNTNSLVYTTTLKSSPEGDSVDLSSGQAVSTSCNVGITDSILVTSADEQRDICEKNGGSQIATDTGQTPLDQDGFDMGNTLPVQTYYYRDVAQELRSRGQTEIPFVLDASVTAPFPAETQPKLCAETDGISNVNVMSETVTSGNNANIVDRVEQSFSIDNGGQTNQVSSRLLERRKTVEVDKNDLSGLEVRHTSYLQFSFGSREQQSSHSFRSEVNIVWGKTIDTDEVSSQERLFRSELCLNPFSDRSLDDSTDYFSADMSSDTIVTSDCTDSFMDSLYTSDYNDSFLEQVDLCPDNTDIKSAIPEEDDFTTKTNHRDLPPVLSTGYVDLTKTYYREAQAKIRQKQMEIGLAMNIDETVPAHQLDRKSLYKVSDNIANLGRGASCVGERDFGSLFHQDCLQGVDHVDMSDLPDHDSHSLILDDENSVQPHSSVETYSDAGVNEILEAAEKDFRVGIVSQSQDDIRDIMFDGDAEVRLNVSRSHVSTPPAAYFMETCAAADISWDNMCSVETAEVSVENQTKPSQEDLRFIQHQDNTILIVSSLKQSDSLSLEDTGKLLLPQLSADASVQDLLVGNVEQTNKLMNVHEHVSVSSDTDYSVDSVKPVTLESLTSDYGDTADLGLLTSDSTFDNQVTTNTDQNGTLMTHVESPLLIDNAAGEVNHRVYQKVAENQREDVYFGDTDYNDDTNQPLAIICDTDTHVTKYTQDGRKTKDSTVEKCVERTEQCLQISDSTRCQRKLQISEVVPSAGIFTGSTDIQRINKLKPEKYLSLSKDNPWEKNQADSGDDSDDGFVLVTSRRKKKLQKKKKKKVQPADGEGIVTDSCDDRTNEDSYISTRHRDDLCQIVDATSSISETVAVSKQSPHEQPVSAQVVQSLDNNTDPNATDLAVTKIISEPHNADLGRVGIVTDSLAADLFMAGTVADSLTADLVRAGTVTDSLAADHTMTENKPETVTIIKPHRVDLALTEIMAEPGTIQEPSPDDVAVTEIMTEPGTIPEPYTDDVAVTEIMTDPGTIPEPPAADVAEIEIVTEPGTIPEPPTADVAVTEIRTETETISESPVGDVAVTEIMTEAETIPEPSTADVVMIDIMAKQGLISEPSPGDVAVQDIMTEPGTIPEPPVGDVIVTEIITEPGTIPESPVKDVAVTEITTEQGTIPEPPTANVAEMEIMPEPGTISEPSPTDVTVTEIMTGPGIILEPPVTDIAVTDIMTEQGTIPEPRTANVAEIENMPEPGTIKKPFAFTNTHAERDTDGDSVSVEQPSKTSAEECSSEEFICQMLEGTDAHAQEYGQEFLHSDECGGMLLNIYTGGHRRILRPYRRFTKHDHEGASLSEDLDSDFKYAETMLEEGQKNDEDSTMATDDVNTVVDETLLDHTITKEGRIKCKGHKRKRQVKSNSETPMPDVEFSELNMSDDSGSLDASLEDLEQTGDDFGTCMSDEDTETSGEKCVSLVDQQDTGSDGGSAMTHHLDSRVSTKGTSAGVKDTDHGHDMRLSTNTDLETETLHGHGESDTFYDGECDTSTRYISVNESVEVECKSLAEQLVSDVARMASDTKASSAAYHKSELNLSNESSNTISKETESVGREANRVDNYDSENKMRESDILKTENSGLNVNYISLSAQVTSDGDQIIVQKAKAQQKRVTENKLEHDPEFEASAEISEPSEKQGNVLLQNLKQERFVDRSETFSRQCSAATLTLTKQSQAADKQSANCLGEIETTTEGPVLSFRCLEVFDDLGCPTGRDSPHFTGVDISEVDDTDYSVNHGIDSELINSEDLISDQEPQPFIELDSVKTEQKNNISSNDDDLLDVRGITARIDTRLRDSDNRERDCLSSDMPEIIDTAAMLDNRTDDMSVRVSEQQETAQLKTAAGESQHEGNVRLEICDGYLQQTVDTSDKISRRKEASDTAAHDKYVRVNHDQTVGHTDHEESETVANAGNVQLKCRSEEEEWRLEDIGNVKWESDDEEEQSISDLTERANETSNVSSVGKEGHYRNDKQINVEDIQSVERERDEWRKDLKDENHGLVAYVTGDVTDRCGVTIEEINDVSIGYRNAESSPDNLSWNFEDIGTVKWGSDDEDDEVRKDILDRSKERSCVLGDVPKVNSVSEVVKRIVDDTGYVTWKGGDENRDHINDGAGETISGSDINTVDGYECFTKDHMKLSDTDMCDLRLKHYEDKDERVENIAEVRLEHHKDKDEPVEDFSDVILKHREDKDELVEDIGDVRLKHHEESDVEDNSPRDDIADRNEVLMSNESICSKITCATEAVINISRYDDIKSHTGFNKSTVDRSSTSIGYEPQISEISNSADLMVNTRERTTTAVASECVHSSVHPTDVTLNTAKSESKQNSKKKKKKKVAKKHEQKKTQAQAREQAVNVKESFGKLSAVSEVKGVAAATDKCGVPCSPDDSVRGASLGELTDVLFLDTVSKAEKHLVNCDTGLLDSEADSNCEFTNNMQASLTADVGNNKTESAIETVDMSGKENIAKAELCQLYNPDAAAAIQVSTDNAENVFNIGFQPDKFPIEAAEIVYIRQGDDRVEQWVDSSSFASKTGYGSIGSGCHQDIAISSPDLVTRDQTDNLFVDRHEMVLPPTPKVVISKRLLEDVISSKARAEQLVAQNPEVSHRQVIHDFNSSSPQPTLTPAGHLMSELGLLETSARDQRDSLKVALQQHQIYLRELHLLSRTIDEAQKKLQESSVSAESVGELRKQMAERTDLTEQIKHYNIQISEVNEKIRQLALDSAQLSPSVFRKHYHPETAYSHYFAATSQNKKGIVPFHSQGQLFYDSLPELNFSSFNDEDFPSLLGTLSQDELEIWKQSEHQNSAHGTTPISLELPRLIPPPRTDSIPRPTWSGQILSTASSSDMSRGTSVSHSIDSPRTMAKAFEASASTSKSVGSVSVSAEQTSEIGNSTITSELGQEVFHSADASNTDTTDSSTDDLSRNILHPDTYSSSAADSTARRLTADAKSAQEEVPNGGESAVTLFTQRCVTENSQISADSFKVSSESVPEASEGSGSGRMLASPAVTVPQHGSTSGVHAVSSLQASVARVTTAQTAGQESEQSISPEISQGQDATDRDQESGRGVETCRKQFDDVRNWLKENTGQQLSGSQPLEEHATLQTQLVKNKGVQEQISKQMQKLSELILQSESLSDEDPIAAQQLLADLLALQKDLEQAKQAAIEKQLMLQAATCEAVDNEAGRTEELGEDIKKHMELIKEIADQGRHPSSSYTADITVGAKVKETWASLSRDLSQKTHNLECTLRTQKLADLVKISLHAPSKHADSKKDLENVAMLVSDLSSAWNLQKTQLDKKQLHPNETLALQQKHQSVLQNISNWLDLAEQQMFTVPLSTEEQVKHNENLRSQIQCLQENISKMNKQVRDQTESTDTANRELTEKCHRSLTERLKMIDTTTSTQAEELHSTEEQWKQYQGGVTSLQRHLQDIQNIIQLPATTQSLDQLMSNNQKTEVQLKMCENQLQELRMSESSLRQKFPKGVFMSELGPLQSRYTELTRKAEENKSAIQNLDICRDHYKKKLKDCAVFLDTAEDKLQEDSLSAKDLKHLREKLAAYKEFFSDIEIHKATLDSLANNCDPSTRIQFQQQHASLSTRFQVLVDQASLHGQRLERLTRQWADLEEKYTVLQKMLFSLEASMPEPVDSEDSLAAIQDKCNKYKLLQAELEENRDFIFDVLDTGKQILHSINCPSLETALAELREKWVSLNTTLTHELKRTESLGDLLSVFDTEFAVISSWLLTAKMKLEGFKNVSGGSLQNISVVRNQVEKILEFRKDVANQVHLKRKVMNIGNQLLQNKTLGLSERLQNFEEEWKQLERGIVDTQEYLLQVQMKLMPSRQALKELTDWAGEMSRSLQIDADVVTTTAADIEQMLNKYKCYQTELVVRQMSVDFVNQTVLVAEAAEVNVSNEKLEFAQNLKDLNKQWHEVTTEINDKLKELEVAYSKWAEFRRTVDTLQSWLRQQEDKIQSYRHIGNEVGVRQSLEDCNTLLQQLKYKQAEIAEATAMGNHLIEISHESLDSQQSIKDSLALLDHNMKKLEEHTRQQQAVLRDMLDRWIEYHTHLAHLNQIIAQADYVLDNYQFIRGDITTLQSQVNKLKDLHVLLEKNSDQLKSFSAVVGELRQVCEPPVRLMIQKIESDIQAKWTQLRLDLMQKCKEYEHCLDEWQRFENQYSRIQDWLDDKEVLCLDLSGTNTGTVSTETLLKCTELQQELDSFHTEISDLHRQNEMLMKHMNPSTVSIMKSRQFAIDQKMMALKQKLSQLSATMSNDLSMHEKFKDSFEDVEKFLNYAEIILGYDDPEKTAEQEAVMLRFEQLKNLLLLFSSNHEHLDDVNDLGYQLALSKDDAVRLRELNHKWYTLYEDTKDKTRLFQDNLLQQQGFASKCEAWKTFMNHSEERLSEQVKGNLRDLSDQLRQNKQFENELYSQQQIIHVILSDGQKMISAGEVEDNDELQRKLNLLSEQWQTVSRKAKQRKAAVEELTNKWHEFNTLSQQLKYWLNDTEKYLDAIPSDSNLLQAIKISVDKIQTVKQEFQAQEATYNKILDLGENLLEHADARAAEQIKATLSDIQHGRLKVLTDIEERRLQLEDIDNQWSHCETEVDDMLCQLADIRRILNADIPTADDELQVEINKCKDIQKACIELENRQKNVLAKKEQLVSRGHLSQQEEDINLLQQRMQLLTKQREELQRQSQVREDKIKDTFYRWTYFNEHLKSLMDWIEDMTVKISNQDISIEDLLGKLENEFKQEAENKEAQKALVYEQGRQLMKLCGDIRASEIEQKLHRLEDRWQHLKGVMDKRYRKLRETAQSLKQLDNSMSNLSQWLSAVESELNEYIIFNSTDLREIEAKLQDSQKLQQDIERHAESVSALLNLCKVLLNDSDACPTETDFLALEHSMKNLERRWETICMISPQRKTSVEETWLLLEKFQDKCDKFSQWITQLEQEVGDSRVDVPNVKTAKEYMKKYEDLQCNIHDHLSDLEQINRIYCQLVKGCIDSHGAQKDMMTQLNKRWDALQQKVAEIVKKLCSSSVIREDFEATQTSMLKWLTDFNEQLAQLQNPPALDLEDRVALVRRLDAEIHKKRIRISYLEQAGVHLMQKADSQEALRVQRELDTFRSLYKTVQDQFVTIKLQVEHLLVAEAEDKSTKHSSEDRHQQLSADYTKGLENVPGRYAVEKHIAELEKYIEDSPPESPAVRQRSPVYGSRTSVSPSRATSFTASAFESSSRRSQSPSLFRSRSPNLRSVDVTRSVSPHRRLLPSQRSPTRLAIDVTGKTDILMEQLADALDDCNNKLVGLEQTFGGTEQSIRALAECETAVEHAMTLHRLLKTETGFLTIDSVDAQVKLVVQRWEYLQKYVKDLRLSKERYSLTQFEKDIECMLTWLCEAEAVKSSSQQEDIVRQYKEFLSELESKKTEILSINLNSVNQKQLKTELSRKRHLAEKFRDMNRRWKHIYAWAAEIQSSWTQHNKVIMRIDNYYLWLEKMETQVRDCEPVTSSINQSVLQEKYAKLQELHHEVIVNQTTILELKETADHLLENTELPEYSTARDKIYIVHKRVQTLKHLISSYMTALENRLKTTSKMEIQHESFDTNDGKTSGVGSSYASRSSTPLQPRSLTLRAGNQSKLAARTLQLPFLPTRTLDIEKLSTELEPETVDVQHPTNVDGPSLLMRVIRAALLFHLLFLLFWLLFWLIPACEDEDSCMRINNLQYSMVPLLRYTDGAPPT